MTSESTAIATPITKHPAPFRRLLRSEATLFARSGGAVLWTALLPIAALIVLGSVPGTRAPSKSLHGMSYLQAYLPILMMFSLCMATVNLLPPTLALYRERGILRRLSTTPVPPSRLLGAQALIYLGAAAVVSVTLLIVAVAGYHVRLPHQLAGFAVALVLIAGATTGLGLVIAALAPNAKAANALSMAAFFPLMFFAGLWVPRSEMPAVLRSISDYTPLGAGVRAIQSSIDGTWPPAASLLVLVAWTVASCGVAERAFRWE